MSTIKTTYIQHPSSPSPNLELAADGTISLPLSGIGDLADVDEGSGAADGDVLTYDGSSSLWLPQPGLAGIGSNVVQTVKTDTFTTTSTSYTTVTGLTATITPSSDTSQVLIIAQVSHGYGNNTGIGHFKVTRGGTDIYVGTTAGSRIANSFGGYSTVDLASAMTSSTIVYLDSPGVATAVTYQVEARQAFNGQVDVNRSNSDSDSAGVGRGASSITVIEVAP